MKTKILLANLLFSLSFILTAQIIHVPGDQPTIQAGINAAMNGDTVLVEDSTYFENIKFMGKAITVASHFLIDGNEDHIDNTIIDGSTATNPDSASTVMFINFEDTTSIICGFTIQGGAGLRYSSWNAQYGGGIACWESGPKILNNKIKDNMIATTSSDCGGAGIGSISGPGNWWMVVDNNVISNNMCAANAESAFGGGIYVSTNAIIRNNIIEDNSCYNAGTQADGGGIEVQQLMGVIIAEIHDNIIQNNTVEGNESFGAGIMIYNASATISNNEINSNSCIAEEDAYGGGICTYEQGETYIINNEVLNNTCDANSSCYGGGYFCDSTKGVLNIIGNEFSNNVMTGAEYWVGAGIYIRNFSDFIHIIDNHFKENGGNNLSWTCGGALVIISNSDKEVVFEKNIIAGNYAKSGAGIYTFNLYDIKIQNNVFRENYAYEKGGAIRFRQYLGDKENFAFIQESDQINTNNSLKGDDIIHPLIINNVFFGNNADTAGGAIASDHGLETPIILNSVFWENNSSIGKDIYNNSENDIIVSYSDIDTTEINTPWTGEYNIYEDPLFIDPQNGDFHLNNCLSHCINAGIDALEIDSTWYYCPTNDIDNETRPYANTLPDMGADETPCLEISIKNYEVVLSSTILNIFPNPFNSATTIELSTLTDNFISLEVYDITGKKIEILLSEKLSKGNHKFNWNVEGLNEGIYFIRVETNTTSVVRKVIILK
ncbi:MAG: T9SS type A sorting domain-containing protein [Bacteroidales bacterium]|nr:T9SS type A sorting domain-containing protein [Bacteroidales bacterium]